MISESEYMAVRQKLESGSVLTDAEKEILRNYEKSKSGNGLDQTLRDQELYSSQYQTVVDAPKFLDMMESVDRKKMAGYVIAGAAIIAVVAFAAGKNNSKRRKK